MNRSIRLGIKAQGSVLGQKAQILCRKGVGIRSERSGIGPEGSGIIRRVRY